MNAKRHLVNPKPEGERGENDSPLLGTRSTGTLVDHSMTPAIHGLGLPLTFPAPSELTSRKHLSHGVLVSKKWLFVPREKANLIYDLHQGVCRVLGDVDTDASLAQVV